MVVSRSGMILSVSIGAFLLEHANLSEKDTKHEVLKDIESPFEY